MKYIYFSIVWFSIRICGRLNPHFRSTFMVWNECLRDRDDCPVSSYGHRLQSFPWCLMWGESWTSYWISCNMRNPAIRLMDELLLITFYEFTRSFAFWSNFQIWSFKSHTHWKRLIIIQFGIVWWGFSWWRTVMLRKYHSNLVDHPDGAAGLLQSSSPRRSAHVCLLGHSLSSFWTITMPGRAVSQGTSFDCPNPRHRIHPCTPGWRWTDWKTFVSCATRGERMTRSCPPVDTFTAIPASKPLSPGTKSVQPLEFPPHRSIWYDCISHKTEYHVLPISGETDYDCHSICTHSLSHLTVALKAFSPDLRDTVSF